ncbi:unnamed protein product [Urochloa decumbens]|uniref:RNase H type-1 domain-containing protein n=1 Tax=Urochloa decumbens TaxID=240449 RepID=A0ABC8V942_9POAL
MTQILQPHIADDLFQTVLTTLWYIWRARNDHRFNNKSWTIWQVHHATNAEIQGKKPFSFADEDHRAVRRTTNHIQGAGQQNYPPSLTYCYTDASIPPENQIIGPTLAGLGIYVQNLQVQGHSALMIKAQVQDATSPLQAETLAAQLAAQVMKALQHQQCKYFSDCQLLVDTLKAPDPMRRPAHWRLRPLIAKIMSDSAPLQPDFCKIARQHNKVAHRLAKQARQSVPHSCNFTCENQMHPGPCPVLYALENFMEGNFSLLSVKCC